MTRGARVWAAMAAVCLLISPVFGARGPSGTFNVRDFGAVGDGKTMDTKAVRAASAALREAGGGTLLFPGESGVGDQAHNGYSYLTGAFNLSSNCVLNVEVGATILGSPNGNDWPLLDARAVWPQMGHGSDCTPGDESCRLMHQAFVFAWNEKNITITGGGTIDAQGQPWWDCADDLSKAPCNGYGRPHLMMLSSVTGVELVGFSVKNSPDWTLHMASVTDLHVDRVSVNNPSNAPNSDGIDLDCVWNALVENSYFNVGDDALCVKSGIDWFGRSYGRPSKDIVFRNITVGTGHGISVGSEMSGGVQNVTFEDIVMSETKAGPRIKSQRGRGGVIDGIVYRNIVASNVHTMVEFTLNYHSGLAPTNATATPVLRNVLLENITFTGGDSAGDVDGLPESHIQNLTLHNVDFNGDKGKWGKCDNVDGGVCSGTTTNCPPCFTNVNS